MCGIVGFSGGITPKGTRYLVDPTKIRWLLHENESRGTHSTGIFFQERPEDPGKIIKNTKKASNFIQEPDVAHGIKSSNIIIGHTRAATSGSIVDANAHPFAFGEHGSKTTPYVVGVHNGFVIEEVANQKWIGEGKLFKESFDVDSEIIFALLSAKGGDYKVLSEVEGALAVAFAMPTKYPGITFLYKRQARELHMGASKEGIYFCSEEEPLHFIDCSSVLPVPDNHLVLLKDGIVLDSHLLPLPKIISIPKNATRHSWDTGVGESELEEYPALLEKKKKSTSWKRTESYNGATGGRSNDYYTSNLRKPPQTSNEFLSSAIEEAKALKREIIPAGQLSYITQAASWAPDDMNACLLVLEILNEVDKKPMCGMLVYDSEDNTYAGPTAPNGVTAFKIGSKDCGVERELIIADPVDGTSVFSYKFTPESNRVLEVTLSLPFRKEGQGQDQGPGFDNKGVFKAANGDGGHVRHLLPARSELSQSNGRGTPAGQGVLFESEDNVYRESPQGEIFGDKGLVFGYGVSDKAPEKRVQSNVNFPERPAADELKSILAEEDRLFRYKKEGLSMLNTQEAAFIAKFLTPAFGQFLNLKRLTSDAVTIKLAQRTKKGAVSWSLLTFAVDLMGSIPYRYRLENESLTESRRRSIGTFCENFRSGKFTYTHKEPLEVGAPAKKP